MERREFLKMLGLGGIALSLPKPAGIVAARLAEITAPPLHVGRCQIGPLADDKRTFLMHKLSVGVQHGIQVAAYEDYCEKWDVTVFAKNMLGDRVVRNTIMRVRAYHMPDHVHRMREVFLPNESEGGEVYKSVMVPDYLSCPKTYRFLPGESLEFWFTPCSHADLPRFPLPKLSVSLGGYMVYKQEPIQTGRDYVLGGRTISHHMFSDVETLQLERAKAIEMGLCLPAEEEGTIV